ncbi:MAG: hypothetical protein M3430_08460 [Acidobacteriota bacterium]|nr:hypothetical protein [Acidobacteriota bacterium]
MPTENEAIEILNVLHENGLEAYKEEVGEEGARRWRVLLKQGMFGVTDEVAMAHRVLQDNGLPRPADDVGVGAAEDGAMFQDEETRKAKQVKAREADIERKLRLLPGVVGVEVSVVEPQDDLVKIDPYPSTASVLLVSKNEKPDFTTATVQGLVARSIPKLKPDDVEVAITTRPAKPLPRREVDAQRRAKIINAVGIGVMTVLVSLVVVLLLQMRRQSRQLSELRESERAPQEDGGTRVGQSATPGQQLANREAANGVKAVGTTKPPYDSDADAHKPDSGKPYRDAAA